MCMAKVHSFRYYVLAKFIIAEAMPKTNNICFYSRLFVQFIMRLGSTLVCLVTKLWSLAHGNVNASLAFHLMAAKYQTLGFPVDPKYFSSAVLNTS